MSVAGLEIGDRVRCEWRGGWKDGVLVDIITGRSMLPYRVKIDDPNGILSDVGGIIGFQRHEIKLRLRRGYAKPSLAVVRAESRRLTVNAELDRLGEILNKSREEYRRALADFQAGLEKRD